MEDLEKATETSKSSIVMWLTDYISKLTEIDSAEIDIHSTFNCYGFDSYQGVVMTYELGAWLGADLDPSNTFDHPSISDLANFLAADPKIRATRLQAS